MSVSEEATTPAPAAAAPTAAAAAFERGKTFFDAGNVLASLTEFDTALDLDDANAIYYVSRAAAFLATDRASDALADAKTALQLLEGGGGGGVTNGSSSGGVSKQQQQQQQQQQDANDSANDVIINSNAAGVTASAQYQVGAALYALKDYSGARSAYASALMLLRDGNAAAAAAAVAAVVVDVSIAAKEGLAKCNSELGLPADSTPDLKPATTTTTTIATAAGSGSSYAPMPVVKRDWYQSATHVVVTFGLRNLAGKDAVETESVDDGCAVSIKAILPSGQAYTTTIGPLWGTIVPQETSVRVSKAKIEVRLKKADTIRWSSLEGAVGGAVVSSTSATATVQGEKTPPQQQAAAAAVSRTAVRMALPSEVEKATTERKTGRDWDKIVTEIKKEEKEEKPEGEAALNQLFQQIYGDGNEDTKRAMMKSYIESNGTVLSTNWDEVKQGKVETKPPEGMEYKKYEQ
eukprot:UC1_evm2s2151